MKNWNYIIYVLATLLLFAISCEKNEAEDIAKQVEGKYRLSGWEVLCNTIDCDSTYVEANTRLIYSEGSNRFYFEVDSPSSSRIWGGGAGIFVLKIILPILGV